MNKTMDKTSISAYVMWEYFDYTNNNSKSMKMRDI